MNTLIGIGTFSSFVFSTYITFFPEEFLKPGMDEPMASFEASVLVIVLVLFGKYMEESAKRTAGNAIKELMNLAPKKALKIEGEEQKLVDIGRIIIGDILLVKPG
jgi:cation transport ATPase